MAVYAGFISPPIAVIDAVQFFCIGEIGLTELRTIPTIGECQLRKRSNYRGGEIDTPPRICEGRYRQKGKHHAEGKKQGENAFFHRGLTFRFWLHRDDDFLDLIIS